MRRSSLILPLCAGFAFLPVTATNAAAQTLAGWVLDQANGTPIALARVTLLDPDSLPIAYTLADIQGLFIVTAPEAGDYRVSAESAFYWNHNDGPVSLSLGDTLWVRITLRPHPVEMDELVVEAGRRYRRMALGGYYDREDKGLGWHFDREEIERYAHFRISEVLRRVPRVTLRRTGFTNYEPVFGGWRSPFPGDPNSICYPRVFVDGMMFSPGGDMPTGIDRVFRPDKVEAIEVFESPWVPAQFHGARAPCGVIAVWSR